MLLVSKLTARTETATERANKIAELLCACAHTNAGEMCPPFAEQWNEYAPDGGSKQQLKEWILSSSSTADSALNAAMAVLCSGAALLRLNTAHIRRSQQAVALGGGYSSGHSIDAPALAEETVDQAVRYGYALLQNNFLSTAAQLLLSAGRESKLGAGTASGRGAKSRVKENLTERAVSEMVSSC
jgi:hypothetical protein